MAWSYKNKGLIRNLGGLVLKPGFERMAVLAGLKKDPFDCYDFLDKLHEKASLKTSSIFSTAEKKLYTIRTFLLPMMHFVN